MWDGNNRTKSVTWGYQIHNLEEPFYVDCWDVDDPDRATWGNTENFESYEDALNYVLFLLSISREEYFEKPWRSEFEQLSQALSKHSLILDKKLKQENKS
jgi:hypothetical protein